MKRMGIKGFMIIVMILVIWSCSDLGEELQDVPAIAVISSLNFGAVTVGDSTDSTLIVSNIGELTLVILSVSLSGNDTSDFQILTEFNGTEILPDSEDTLLVQFKPSSDESKSATITIESNDPDAEFTNVALLGTGGEALPLVTFDADIDPIIGPSGSAGCSASCHTNFSSSGWTYDAIVGISSSSGMNYISPGDTLTSYLYLKITGASSISGSRMPASNPTYFDNNPEQLATIATWIMQGAQESAVSQSIR